jgi:DNA-directed RNA polymerase specialized sigma24 family protein
MDANEALAERFEEHRIRLRAVAYRMLGSLSEADDAVQEAWLRLSGAEAKDVENLGGWLTTVVARVCLNMLRRRRTRPEVPLDPTSPIPSSVPRPGWSPRTRRSWPTPSGSHSWSSWTRCRRRNAWRSCCTICSRCPST